MRRAVRTLPALLAAALLVGGVGWSVAAGASVTFGAPEGAASFGRELAFRQPVSLPGDVDLVEILLEQPGSLGPHAVEVDAGSSRSTTLSYELDLGAQHVLPNTPVTARWRVTLADGSRELGPPVTVRYADDRLPWRTLEGEIVRVHWHEGSDAFGRRALEIGEQAVRETSELLGVTEREPIDFFVYANQDEFYDALGPGTRENVGGQANAEIRTLFALVGPGAIDDPWVSVVVPHELVHLVFDTAVRNPYHFPPRWLNEGLAVYLSQGYDAADRRTTERAAGDGSLIPLDGLVAQFPTTRDRFFLAYSESVSAVDFMIRTFGRDALVSLVRSYATGLSDDEAFEAALGVDVAAFDAAWREELGAGEPQVFGPRDAPPGPLPAGWGQAGPGPDAPGPTAPAGTPRPGAPVGGTGGDGLPLPVILAALAALIGGVGVVLLARSRRTPAARGDRP